MEFADFADRAAAIGAEEADSAIVEGVTQLFADAGEDLAVVARLIQGRAFPGHDSTKLDVGPALCYEAIARAAEPGVDADDVEERLAEYGDIGEVAASYDLGGQQGLAAFGDGGTDPLTVAELAEELERLAAASGEGSRDTKLDVLFGLFNRCSPDEARYLARIVLSEMRIGVGEGTVRDAIAAAFDVPVDVVERALQVSNDYGRVAEVAREEGVEGLDAMELAVGRPIKAMLAQAGTVNEAIEDWETVGAEWKFDGARCISGYTPLYINGRGATVVRDVDIGDEVLTHTGNYQEIIAKSSRTIEKGERVFDVSTYLGEEFKITEGHQLLVATPSGISWERVEDISTNSEMVFPVPAPNVEDDPPQSIELSTISNYTKEIDRTDDFFRFLGYWVGDGSSNEHNKNQRISLVFPADADELLSSYADIVTSELGISPENIHRYDHNGATSIYWTDSPLLTWLSRNFRKQDQEGWRDKKIPSWIWNITKSEFESFLQGWFEADGYTSNDNQQRIVTKERDLASEVQLIGLQFDRIIGFSRRRRNGKTYYVLDLVQSDRYARIENDYVYVKILKKEELSRSSPREVDPRQRVYDLQVKQDHSYCSPMVSLHNCQIHFDGDTPLLFSRNMEDVTAPLPEVVEAVEAGVEGPAILDGEVVAIDDEGDPLPFQEILRRFRRKHDVEQAREDVAVEFRAFDCLHVAGEDLLSAPFSERHDRLLSIVDDAPDLFVSELTVTDDPEEVAAIEAESLSAGHEGVMLKNPDSPYTPGRTGKNWLKVKPDVETVDLVVTGAEWGEGRRANFLGTFELSVRTDDGFATIGNVATGVTDEQLAELTELLEPHIEREDGQDVDLEPAVVFEVGYEEIQTSPTYESGYALRFPRFVAVREDKDPEDADALERVERLA